MEIEELVIGFDFNCAGSIPIINGFLQLGASARDLKTGDLVDSFHEYSNMEGYECDPKVMKQLQKINEVEHMLVMEGVYIHVMKSSLCSLIGLKKLLKIDTALFSVQT
jgi:hypothetical protein